MGSGELATVYAYFEHVTGELSIKVFLLMTAVMVTLKRFDVLVLWLPLFCLSMRRYSVKLQNERHTPNKVEYLIPDGFFCHDEEGAAFVQEASRC